MLTKWIVKISFYFHGSKRYKKIKETFYNFLQNSDYQYKKYFDVFMILLILSSIGILVYEVKHPVPEWVDFFDIYMVTFIFVLEYLLRFWVYNDFHTMVVKSYEEAQFLNKPFLVSDPIKATLMEKLKYITSPAAIIDLLAILPAYRPLRVLRIFVLFRVFKLLRYTKSIHQFMDVLANKRFELLTLLFLLVFLVLTSGVAIYVFEETHNESINSLFDAIYWAFITISTVGYGDISPITPEGRIVSMVVIVSGIAMISFLTSIIVSAFSEKLDELKENRMVEEMNKSRSFIIICGYGQMTRMFLKNNIFPSSKYVILEKDAERVAMGLKEGYNLIHEDASRYEVLEKFNVKYSDITLLALNGSDVANIYITLNAKALSQTIKVITRASNERMAHKCRLAGANHVVLPNMVANKMLLIAITAPTMYRAIYAILAGQHIAQLDEVPLVNYRKLVGKKIEEIDFKEYKLLFLGFQCGDKKEFIFNPPLKMRLEVEDVLLVMGRKVSIEYFKNQHEEVSYVS